MYVVGGWFGILDCIWFFRLYLVLKLYLYIRLNIYIKVDLDDYVVYYKLMFFMKWLVIIMLFVC